jgi:hypothetical protein
MLALNEPGRCRPTRTLVLAWPLRVVLSERPAASLGAGIDAVENELAIVDFATVLPCLTNALLNDVVAKVLSGLLSNLPGQQVAEALVVRPRVGACLLTRLPSYDRTSARH